MGDLYSVLNVPASASQADIKDSFRKLALQYHPDRHLNSGKQQQLDAEAKFKAVNEAYKVLGNEQSRRQYDLRHSPWQQAGVHSNKTGAHSTVNRDWARSYYQHNAHDNTYTSRLGWWQVVGRMFRQRVRTVEAVAHSTLLVVLGSGLAFAAIGSEALWEWKNKGKRFEDVTRRTNRLRPVSKEEQQQ